MVIYMSRYFGVDYYPEHWPRERWEEDARLMEKMGIGLVRMAEFAWAHLEPAAGIYDFDWSDEAIATLARHNIRTILGTPTAAPPAWLIQMYPESLPMDKSGVRQSFGGRHHCCHSNPALRRRIRLLVTAMAKHYGQCKDVTGWQIDNELGNSHDELCFCPSCTDAFQTWLTNKYGDIQTLNAAWGTAFWSQKYDDFSQISAPMLNVTAHNPSLLLDWRRFCSDLIVHFQHAQAEILRQHCPGQFLTHNMMGYADKVNYFHLARDLDFVSQDQYPYYQEDGKTFRNMENLSSALELIRGAKQKNFWVMEQQAGPAGWQCFGPTPAPGQLYLWTCHSIAHGADTVLWFRWRTCTFGTEQYWHGILPHNGTPGGRYQELQRAISDLTPVMEKIQGLGSGAETAILYSYDQNSALKIHPCHPSLEYRQQVQILYGGLYRRNVMVDFIPESADFSSYKLLIAPLLTLVTPELCDKLKDYVHGGGTLLLTARSGVHDETGKCISNGDLPHGLSSLCGLIVVDYSTIYDGPVSINWQDHGISHGSYFCDRIVPNGCRTLACYDNGPFAETSALTMNSFGKGRVFYLGTFLEQTGSDILAEILLAASGVESVGDTPDGVELCMRSGPDGDYIFVLNHTNHTVPYTPPADWTPLLHAESELAPYGVHIYLRPHDIHPV